MLDRVNRDAVEQALPAAIRAAIAARHNDPVRDMENLVAANLREESTLDALFISLRQVEPDKNAVTAAERKAERLLRTASAGAVLATVEMALDQQRVLYRASMPDASVAPEPRDPDQILELLDGARSRDGVMNRMHEFLERVNRKAQHAPLDEWLDDNVSKAELTAIRQFLDAESAGQNQSKPYLSIAVNTLELRANETPHLRAWLWRRLPDGSPDPEAEWNEPCDSTPESIQQAFHRLLDKARASAGSQLNLEFIVPREQLCIQPENWKIKLDKYSPETPIGRSFPVILRWRDRIQDPRSPITIDWSARAAAIRARKKAPSLLWVDAGALDGPMMRAKVQHPQSPECVGLAFAPPPAPDDFTGDLLVQALAAGAPFLCWMNGQPADIAALQKDMKLEVEAGLDNVPLRLYEHRANGGAIGASISIVWDDPAHMPQVVRAKPV
jgi:hypothetical protein